MDKVDELYSKGFNINNDIVIFPIRHHSPVCSYHLEKLIQDYKPDKILIEGPRESQGLKDFIVDEDTKPPISIYYSFDDKNGEVNSNCDKYYCYYPFLDFSPEYIALKLGKELSISTSFIDLSYGERLVLEKSEIKNRIIGSDSNLSYSSYVLGLCENEGCRDFNEYYERKFEINGLYKSTKDFVYDMYAFCYYARISTGENEIELEGNLVREKYMASCIQEEKGNKTLVVVGGFHVKGILDCLENHEIIKKRKVESSSYLMPYSLKECNSLFGYSAGIPYIGFYKDILGKLKVNPYGAYDENVINYIISICRALRKEKVWISTPDEIECYKLARGLLSLRGKKEVGLYELLDGLRATFIKGEVGYGTVKFFDCIDKLLMGDGIGRVSVKSNVPPLVLDFRKKLKEYRFKIEEYTSRERVLDIYKNPKHLEISRFFNSTIFLEIGFCEIIKGPDLFNKKDLNLIRSTYKYKWEYSIESKLINLSVYGGTLKEACINIILKNISECNSTIAFTKYLIWCVNIGLINELTKLIPTIEEIIVEDCDFISLVNGLYNINYLINLIHNEEDQLKEILLLSLNRCYIRVCELIPSLKNIKQEGEEQYINALIDIFNFRIKSNEEALLKVQLLVLSNDCENYAILGSVYGILYGFSEVTILDICNEINVSREFSRFIKGLILSSKDLIYREESIIDTLNNRIKSLSRQEFLNVLPHLRFGFNILTPVEKDTLGRRLKKMFKAEVEGIEEILIDSNMIIKISNLEEEGVKLLKERWSFIE